MYLITSMDSVPCHLAVVTEQLLPPFVVLNLPQVHGLAVASNRQVWVAPTEKTCL